MTGSPRVTLRSGPAQENPESQARKRPPPAAGASILAEANDNILVASQSTASRPAPGSCQLAAPGPSLKVAANIVVKCLTPFYKEGKFASKVGQGLGHGAGRAGMGATGKQAAPAATLSPGHLALWSGLSALLLALHPQDLFKAFARHLSHSLAQKPSPGRSGECLGGPARRHWGPAEGDRPSHSPPPPNSLVKEEAQHLIKQFFRGRARCESEADWHGLWDPQR